MHHDLHIRAARPEDLVQISDLLTQLYAAELPGALGGTHDKQAELLRFTLAAKNNQGLRHRYVLCDQNGTILATAALDMPGEPAYERAPDGTIATALKVLGVGHTVRLLLTVARSMLVHPNERPAGSALLHSVVVDEAIRGQGLGRVLMAEIEAKVRASGMTTIVLQVLVANQPAHRFYQELGYQPYWRSPSYLSALSWPIMMLRKEIA
ncbi:GNAT family N-acetyltransferase [Candidatus Oscillochloris fontis]|uniref:GNAT family N-acetyltransferase n=1 Tax=Candidatus Oscillochloris fontis TaxID=2496868 RepID=UPI00101DD7C2|nr:GNAT family N-acetyltransferase [Candidatus Oscillochloris fontis]